MAGGGGDATAAAALAASAAAASSVGLGGSPSASSANHTHLGSPLALSAAECVSVAPPSDLGHPPGFRHTNLGPNASRIVSTTSACPAANARCNARATSPGDAGEACARRFRLLRRFRP